MKLDDKASEWLDGRLVGSERDRYRRELEADPEKAREVEELERVVEVLRVLPDEPTPPDLLRDIQRRIRRRSHGRHYGGSWRQRLPFEALVTGLLVVVMGALYLWNQPTRDPLAPVSPKVFMGGGNGVGLAGSVLSYGLVVGEALIDDGKAVRLTVEVPRDKVDALLAEVGLYPELRVERGPPRSEEAAGGSAADELAPGAEPGTVLVRVIAQRGR